MRNSDNLIFAGVALISLGLTATLFARRHDKPVPPTPADEQKTREFNQARLIQQMMDLNAGLYH